MNDEEVDQLQSLVDETELAEGLEKPPAPGNNVHRDPKDIARDIVVLAAKVLANQQAGEANDKEGQTLDIRLVLWVCLLCWQANQPLSNLAARQEARAAVPAQVKAEWADDKGRLKTPLSPNHFGKALPELVALKAKDKNRASKIVQGAVWILKKEPIDEADVHDALKPYLTIAALTKTRLADKNTSNSEPAVSKEDKLIDELVNLDLGEDVDEQRWLADANVKLKAIYARHKNRVKQTGPMPLQVTDSAKIDDENT